MRRKLLPKPCVLSAIVLVSLLGTLSAHENLDWGSRSLSAGKVDVATGAYGLTRTLAVANFAPEFRLPIQMVYNSGRAQLGAPGLFGSGWSCPQLESRVFPEEDGATWQTPWGEDIRFYKKDKGAGCHAPYTEWTASGSGGNWTIERKDGWKFSYKGSRLRETTAPSGRKLEFSYDGDRLLKVSTGTTTFVSLEYGKDEMVSSVTVNDESFSLAYTKKTISVLPDKPGRAPVEIEKPFLAKIAREAQRNESAFPHQNAENCDSNFSGVQGNALPESRAGSSGRPQGETLPEVPTCFGYSKDGFLSKISRGDFSEELVTQEETLRQREDFLKKAAADEKAGRKGTFQEARAGRLLKDKDYEYTYMPDGSIVLKDAAGRTASFAYSPLRGVLKTTDFTGKKTKLFYYRRYSVAYNGKIRQIRDQKDRIVLNCRYDKDSGKPTIVRDMLGNETAYSYDKSGNLSLVSRSEDDNPRRPLVSFKYDSRGNPREISLLDKTGKPATTTKLQFDSKSQLSSAETDESSVKMLYTPSGMLAKTTDTFGRTVSREYDKFNRLLSVTADSGAKTSYIYEA